MSNEKGRPDKGFPEKKQHWRALVQFSEEEIGATINMLARRESRQRAAMTKRLVLEALAARGFWDLDTHALPKPSNIEPIRTGPQRGPGPSRPRSG